MSIEAPQHFERRVDAVFGALDSVAQPSNQSATGHWSLARQQVFRCGLCFAMAACAHIWLDFFAMYKTGAELGKGKLTAVKVRTRRNSMQLI